MRQLVTRQHNLGPWLGALKMQGARAMFYMALPQLPLTAIAATPQLQKWFPWLPFWVILATLAAFFAVFGMWLDYLLILPSEMSFNNAQAYKHKNPFQSDMAEVKTRLGRIERKLGIEE